MKFWRINWLTCWWTTWFPIGVDRQRRARVEAFTWIWREKPHWRVFEVRWTTLWDRRDFLEMLAWQRELSVERVEDWHRSREEVISNISETFFGVCSQVMNCKRNLRRQICWKELRVVLLRRQCFCKGWKDPHYTVTCLPLLWHPSCKRQAHIEVGGGKLFVFRIGVWLFCFKRFVNLQWLCIWHRVVRWRRLLGVSEDVVGSGALNWWRCKSRSPWLFIFGWPPGRTGGEGDIVKKSGVHFFFWHIGESKLLQTVWTSVVWSPSGGVRMISEKKRFDEADKITLKCLMRRFGWERNLNSSSHSSRCLWSETF